MTHHQVPENGEVDLHLPKPEYGKLPLQKVGFQTDRERFTFMVSGRRSDRNHNSLQFIQIMSHVAHN